MSSQATSTAVQDALFPTMQESTAVQFLQEHGVLHRERKCTCGNPMSCSTHTSASSCGVAGSSSKNSCRRFVVREVSEQEGKARAALALQCLARRLAPHCKMRCSQPCRKVPRCSSSKNTECSTVRGSVPAVTQCHARLILLRVHVASPAATR
ncbi:hypothetical protein M514_05028 [Trichuris suis]|uniref:Uncharacterized protein n=1 Tax=Trichuris suis TaxID=68888 RepID=A0A085NCX0_9BILA|nr:hypothetical protein M514_05028 [Trichuris suis]